MPDDLATYVTDVAAAKVLGKLLFWDMQVGSDGVQACASCHYHAGADHRFKNQINPGPGNVFNNFASGSGGPNYSLKSGDFPFHQLAVPDDNGSEVLSDTDDRASSQGVFRFLFTNVNVGSAVDSGTEQADPNNFAINGINTRRVEPRNTPTMINAIFLHRIFFDGRANHFFNGNNPFGDTDVNSSILIKQGGNPGDPVVPTHVLLNNGATASQAVGPPGSPFEMSFDGRDFANIGRKMVVLNPLAGQVIDPTDSLLGAIADPSGPGLADHNVTYSDLVQLAFAENLWGSDMDFGGFSQMEKNFAFFFGLSIEVYEATLVSDQTPFDAFQEGGGEGGTNSNALTAQQKEGLDIFLNRGSCIACHLGPTFGGASIAAILGPVPAGAPPPEGPLERMLMANGMEDGNLLLTTSPPPVGEPLHPGAGQLSGDPRGKLVEIRQPSGVGSPLAWGFAYFSTSVGLCSPAIDEKVVLTPGNGAPANIDFSASIRLRVDTDCSKAFRVDMSWENPGLPGGDYTVFVGGRLMGVIHMDQVQGPAVYDNGFYNIGVRPTVEDIGNGGSGPFGPFAFAARAQAGQNVDNGMLQPPVGANERIAVNGAFKAISLRNSELTGPYMHNGGFSTLEQVVDFYTGGAHFEQANQADLDPFVGGIGGMNPERKAALVSFIKSLTDERVRIEAAPFDHPQLFIPNGHPGDETGTTLEGGTMHAEDSVLEIAATGAAGGPPLEPFDSQLPAAVMALVVPNQPVSEVGTVIGQTRVVLARRPAANVTVNLSVNDVTEGTVTPSSMVFTPQNWSTPQIVVVRGVQDMVVDGSVPFKVITSNAISTDPKFNGLNVSDIQIVSTDSGMHWDYITKEAESGVRTSPMIQVTDSSASGGKYVTVPNGTGNQLSPTGAGGIATFTFTAPVAGSYIVWVLEKSPTTNDDSFWVNMDGSPYQNWTMYRGTGTQWVWDKVNNSGAQDPIVYTLSAGNHTLKFKHREDGARLDKIVVTNDLSFVPTGAPVGP